MEPSFIRRIEGGAHFHGGTYTFNVTGSGGAAEAGNNAAAGSDQQRSSGPAHNQSSPTSPQQIRRDRSNPPPASPPNVTVQGQGRSRPATGTTRAGRRSPGHPPVRNSGRTRTPQSVSRDHVNDPQQTTRGNESHGTSIRSGNTQIYRTRADHDVYYEHLLFKGKGSPMWIPGPDMTLPLEYRKRGIGIGDIGILYCAHGFTFLFNIFLPADHPINAGRVPDGFKPFDYSRLQLGRKMQVLGKGNLASNSVQSRNGPNSSDFVFDISAPEGAILVFPEGGISEDNVALKSIKEYLANNAERWCRFVKGMFEVDNGDIRLVIGCDKVSSWGIATVAASHGGDESVRLEFRSAGQSGQVAGTQTYTWSLGGCAQGRVGPEEGSMQDVRPISGEPPILNQTVFIRTVNFALSEDAWNASNVHQVRSDGRFSSSSPPGPSKGKPPGSSKGHSRSGTGSSNSTHGKSWHYSMKRTVIHPSNEINRILLTMYPGAYIAITEDADWLSVIWHDNEILDSEKLLARFWDTGDVYEEDGIVTFKRLPMVQNQSDPPRTGISAKIVGFMQTIWRSATRSAGNLVVVCIGPNGGGKSQLIDCLTRQTSWANEQIKPEKHSVRAIKTTIPGENQDVILVDTPGFDDVNESSSTKNVLEDVQDWLKRKQKDDVKVFVLYLHDITNNRLTAPPPMSLLTKLCGSNAARQFVVITTHWDHIKLENGMAREAELRTGFRALLLRGATIARFNKTPQSAWDIVKPLLKR